MNTCAPNFRHAEVDDCEGYGDVRTIERIVAMEKWLAQPDLLEADADCEYAEVLEIDMNTIKEPILCVPNDPDDARLLSSG